MFQYFNQLIINYETLKYLRLECKEIKIKNRVTEKGKGKGGRNKERNK
jgi:hypothetical protein